MDAVTLSLVTGTSTARLFTPKMISFGLLYPKPSATSTLQISLWRRFGSHTPSQTHGCPLRAGQDRAPAGRPASSPHRPRWRRPGQAGGIPGRWLLAGRSASRHYPTFRTEWLRVGRAAFQGPRSPRVSVPVGCVLGQGGDRGPWGALGPGHYQQSVASLTKSGPLFRLNAQV